MTAEEIIRQVIQEEDELLEKAESKHGLDHGTRMLVTAELRMAATKIIERLKEENNNGN